MNTKPLYPKRELPVFRLVLVMGIIRAVFLSVTIGFDPGL